MQNKFALLDKQFDIDKQYIRLLIIIFIVAVLAKGPVLFRGFAADDYKVASGVESPDLTLVISQGRYIGAAVMRLFNALGTNINDMYFPFGIVALLLYSALIVSILRFVGIADSPAAGLVGGIMIAHPYLTELFTFRMLLPALSVALIFSIIALEMVMKVPATRGARAFALLATLAMLLTYQIFLNYLAVAIIFAFIFGQVLHNKNSQALATNNNIYRERAITLMIISAVAAIVFILIMWLGKALSLTYVENRASVIKIDMIPERIKQISSALVNIYWSAEPVLSGGLKKLVALMLVISGIIISWRLLTDKGREYSIRSIFMTLFAFLLLIPVSLGVIVPFGDWWPVPRVISHVAIIIGLIYLVADSCIPGSSNRFLMSINFILRIVVLIGFIFLSNQILADQQKINLWDRMMANRIISRLEMHPNFSNVKFVHVNGGSWSYPVKLRTPQGDLNVSALYVPYSKASLLSEVSGYKFEWAIGTRAATGEKYCQAIQPWPHAESITVDNDVAIICLKKQESNPLIDASWAGKVEVVSSLLYAESDVNSASSSGLTALSAAVMQKHETIALLLLEHGANPNVVYSNGNTPLIEAAWQGSLPVLKALLAKGAAPNYKRPDDGLTALKAAMSVNKADVVQALKDAGAIE